MSYPTTRSGRYLVTGKADFATVVFTLPVGTIPKGKDYVTHLTIPWEYSFTALPGERVHVSAQRSTPGDVACSIEVDGDTIETDTSSGPHAICSVSAEVP